MHRLRGDDAAERLEAEVLAELVIRRDLAYGVSHEAAPSLLVDLDTLKHLTGTASALI